MRHKPRIQPPLPQPPTNILPPKTIPHAPNPLYPQILSYIPDNLFANRVHGANARHLRVDVRLQVEVCGWGEGHFGAGEEVGDEGDVAC